MTGQSDDYLAQLDQALERIEATNVDSDLAAAHAPHLLRQGDPGPAILQARPATDSQKIDLAVSLLQSDVDIGASAANETSLDPKVQEESGLGIELERDALTLSRARPDPKAELLVSQSLNEASLSDLPTQAIIAPSIPKAQAAPALRLESQEISLGGAASLAGPVSSSGPLPASPSLSQSKGSHSDAAGFLDGRRGIFSPKLAINLLLSLAAATWLALWPAYELTQGWLSERSHVAMQELKASATSTPKVASRPSPTAAAGSEPVASTQALADTLLAQAELAQSRFLWTWALIALLGTILLALPYRRES